MKKLFLCLLFLSQQAFAQKLVKATFAGGCFWCVEADLEKIPGVQEVISGYAGGELKSPSYKKVSSGATKHLEAVQVTYDPKKVSYQKLLQVFWKTIDPTDDQGQFVDRGYQYTTAIFYHSEDQKKLAEQSKNYIKKKKWFKKDIVTPIRPFKNFYPAEKYHQDYYKGTLSSLKYQFYRSRSGRDDFIKKYWGNKTIQFDN